MVKAVELDPFTTITEVGWGNYDIDFQIADNAWFVGLAPPGSFTDPQGSPPFDTNYVFVLVRKRAPTKDKPNPQEKVIGVFDPSGPMPVIQRNKLEKAYKSGDQFWLDIYMWNVIVAGTTGSSWTISLAFNIRKHGKSDLVATGGWQNKLVPRQGIVDQAFNTWYKFRLPATVNIPPPNEDGSRPVGTTTIALPPAQSGDNDGAHTISGPPPEVDPDPDS